jgi:hypothetical protein
MATTHTIYWKKDDGEDDDACVVWIDIAKVDEAWRLTSRTTGYLEPGSGSRETFRYLRSAVTGVGLLRMPNLVFLEVRWPKQHIDFVDGRHRFAFVRDHAGVAMPVTIAREDVSQMRSLFGSEARTCEVRI